MQPITIHEIPEDIQKDEYDYFANGLYEFF
jgi:hypothetical protein